MFFAVVVMMEPEEAIATIVVVNVVVIKKTRNKKMWVHPIVACMLKMDANGVFFFPSCYKIFHSSNVVLLFYWRIPHSEHPIAQVFYLLIQ